MNQMSCSCKSGDNIIPFDILDLPRARFKAHRNSIFVFTGDPGSGKSWNSISVAQHLDPEFSIDQVCFGKDDFLTVFPELKRGQMIVYEEAGAEFGSRDAMTGANKELSKILQVYRFKQIPTIFNLPHMSMLDKNGRRLMNYWVKADHVDFINNAGVGIFYIIKPDDWNDEIRRYKVRVRDINTGLTARIDSVNFPQASKKLLDDYEKRKTEYFTELFGGYYERSQAKQVRQEKRKETADALMGKTPSNPNLYAFINALRGDE